MTALVPIEPGLWVSAYREEFYRGPFSLPVVLERLAFRGSHWDCLRKPSDQFDVMLAGRVMPKTFLTPNGKRHWRYLVVATGSTDGEMIALRDKLFAIGFDAETAIDQEIERRITDFAEKTRADALAKVHAALPHIFGRTA